jgi:hypothetical protein
VTVTHPNCVVVNESILDWQRPEEGDCFIIALEVLDNFPHDKVREKEEYVVCVICLCGA